MSEIFCSDCGQATKSADARTIRHYGCCSCLFCEVCGDIVGDTMESAEWNEEQKREHDVLAHPGVTALAEEKL